MLLFNNFLLIFFGLLVTLCVLNKYFMIYLLFLSLFDEEFKYILYHGSLFKL